jgi:MFS family permease
MTTIEKQVTRRTRPDTEARRGRWAVTAVFLLNGLTLASYIVRLPSIKVAQHLSDAQLGMVSTVFGAAAIIAMQFVGALVARYGSARVIRIGLVALPLVLVGIGLARGFLGLAVAGVLLGVVHGTLDVSMNGHAVAVERRLGRPIMNGCHGAWSVSAVAASLTGAALIAAHVAVLSHFIGIAAVVTVAGLVVGRYLLPASADRAPSHDGRSSPQPGWRSGWSRAVIALGLTGTVLMVAEGAVLTWSGVFLHDIRGASLALASLAVTAFTACQTGGRLFGDRLTVRYGAGRLFRTGALVAMVGFAVAVLVPDAAGAVAGFAVVGFGGAFLIPLTFRAAGHAGGTGPGAAGFVARFTTFTYTGILLGPALIGWVAQGIGLQWTLALIVPLLGTVAVLTGLP